MTPAHPTIRARPTAGRRRNLLVVRCGDASLHRRWLTGARPEFDLLVSYYGETPDKFAEDGDLYHAKRGTRWMGHADLLKADPTLFEAYAYICFACDDLDADASNWNELFRRCNRFRLDLAQPAILGPVSYPITAPVDGLLYRTTTFVEVMCPVFSRRALQLCQPIFEKSLSGWGLDVVWSKIVSDTGGRMGIIDSVTVTHTRALREGSLYSLLDDLGVEPTAEAERLMAAYGIAHKTIQEIERFEKRRWSLPFGKRR